MTHDVPFRLEASHLVGIIVGVRPKLPRVGSVRFVRIRYRIGNSQHEQKFAFRAEIRNFLSSGCVGKERDERAHASPSASPGAG